MSISMINVVSSTNGRSSIFGERRNRLKSTWDILFGDQPKEWISFKPTLGAYVFPCYTCRHMFSSFFSLQDHINRRIIVLKYNCRSCPDDVLTFYNRCALLLHARLHYNLEEGQINLMEIDTFTLPIDLAGFLPLPDIPVLFEREEEIITDSVYVNVQFYVPSNDQRGKQIILLKPDDFTFKENNVSLGLKQVCKNIPKCQFIPLNEQTRLKERALLADGVDVNSNIKVELFDYVDQFTLPIISKVESLHEKTYHIPRCLDCNSVQNGTMAQHYQGNNKPTDTTLTCPRCKFVASTKCSFRAHVRIHNSEAPHVCPDCGKDFDTPEILQKHLEDVCFHLAKHVKFRCPGKRCSKLFASLTNFAAHFKQHFKCVYTCTVCSLMLFSVSNLEEHIVFHSGNCTFSRLFECSICPLVGAISESEYNDHIDMHTKNDAISMYVYMCRHCRSFFRSTLTFATHLLKCSSKMFAELNKNRRPGSKSKLVITKKYFCILCNEQIPLEKKVSHMRLCKYAHPVIYVDKLNDIWLNDSYSSSSEYNTSIDSKRTTNDSLKSEENGKKRRRRCLTDVSRRRRPDKGIEPDLIADKPMEFDGTYYCKLCDYHSSERAEFHSHIRRHRDISTAYQCMECGECFVVKPTLNKHLMHFHNISDYESYLRENDCFDVEAVKELETIMRLAPGESKEPVKENQCRVCLDEFEDSSTLNTHFRMHGMAFLLKNSK